jgi:hypothetical protein
MRETIIEYCGFDEPLMFLDEIFDDCLIGVSGVCNNFTPAYNYDKIIEKLNQTNILFHDLIQNHEDISFITFLSSKPETFIFDDLKDAFVGFKIQKNKELVETYDSDLCLNVLTKDCGDEDSAMEWFEYNVTQTYIGVTTPAIIYKL